jgi:beta-glucanase (GH16 family)
MEGRWKIFASAYGLAVVGAGALLVVGPELSVFAQQSREMIDTSRLKKSFADDFDSVSFDQAKWGKNDPVNSVEERTLVGNAEREVYVDPDWLGMGIQPITQASGVLRFTANPLPDHARALIHAQVTSLPSARRSPVLDALAYSSGRISTRGSFSQRYGYFEMRARFSAGQGLWPAFWLLPADGSWPPEIDIMEVLGHEPDKIYTTVHSSMMPKQGGRTEADSTPDGYHRYGVMWGPAMIDFYLDGAKVQSMKTPPDAHKPMYITANLAVGGHWPGDPDASTRFPATMDIDYIRAWQYSGGR